jgi:chromosome partitioning protein
MAAKIFTVAQQKGGAGKSTLAAHLAVAWLARKKRVALVDIDPQSTLADWFAARQETLGEGAGGLAFESVTGWRAAKAIDALAREMDFVVVDSPPHAETDARVAVRAADLVVIPTQPSPPDVWATRPTLDLAAKEKRPAVLVLNRVPPRALLTDRMTEKLAGYDVKIAKSRLGNRVAFAESMAEGLTASEYKKSSQAAKEIRALANELQKKA